MHYLLATWDGAGTAPIDFGIARRLVARGHTVTVIGDPTLEAEAARSDAEFVPWRLAPHRPTVASVPARPLKALTMPYISLAAAAPCKAS